MAGSQPGPVSPPHATACTTAQPRIRSRSSSSSSESWSSRRRMRASGRGIAHQLRAAVAHQRRAVERALADQRLGVDREPAAVLVEQHVAGVGVLVQDHRLAGGSAAARGRGRRRGRARRGWVGGRRASLAAAQVVHHLIEAQRTARPPAGGVDHRRRSTPAAIVLATASSGSAFSLRAGARRSTSSARRSASASSSRAAPLPSQWASAAASCSLSGSGKVIFSTARRAVAPLGGHDERDRGRLERVAEPQIPLLGALRGQAGERGEPLRAALLRAPPPQPIRHLACALESRIAMPLVDDIRAACAGVAGAGAARAGRRGGDRALRAHAAVGVAAGARPRRRVAGGARRLLADAQRDQLRLGLVPDPAQAGRAARASARSRPGCGRAGRGRRRS